MKVFCIFGGLGFIGSNFIIYLFARYKNIQIINVDDLSYCSNLHNLHPIKDNPNYKFIKGDIKDVKLMKSIFAYHDIDYVINFAAETHVDRSVIEGSLFFKTNFLGLQSLLEAASNHTIKKLIHVSTDEVYGSIKRGSFKEKGLLNPSSPYSSAKASADILCKTYMKNVPIVIARPCNNFGPRQYPEKLIPLFILRLLKDKKIPLYGNGKNKREWLFVTDTCYALDILINKGMLGEIYNIGSGFEIPNYKLTLRMLSLMKKPKTLINFVKDRPGHDFRYSINSKKIRKLGWKPQMSFIEGLKSTISWYEKMYK